MGWDKISKFLLGVFLTTATLCTLFGIYCVSQYKEDDIEDRHSPAYTPSSRPLNFILTPEIHTDPIPKWTWSNAQYRAWLFLFYTERLSMSIEDVETIARDFEGHDPRMYLRWPDEWKDTFELEHDKGSNASYNTKTRAKKHVVKVETE